MKSVQQQDAGQYWCEVELHGQIFSSNRAWITVEGNGPVLAPGSATCPPPCSVFPIMSLSLSPSPPHSLSLSLSLSLPISFSLALPFSHSRSPSGSHPPPTLLCPSQVSLTSSRSLRMSPPSPTSPSTSAARPSAPLTRCRCCGGWAEYGRGRGPGRRPPSSTSQVSKAVCVCDCY